MIGGFEGMVHASILNDSEAPTTTFQITYDNGTTKIVTIKDGTSNYYYYMNLVR